MRTTFLAMATLLALRRERVDQRGGGHLRRQDQVEKTTVTAADGKLIVDLKGKNTRRAKSRVGPVG